MMIAINDVVQFNELHDWCGCFGIVLKMKECKQGIRCRVCVCLPDGKKTYTDAYEHELEYIGRAMLVPIDGESEEE